MCVYIYVCVCVYVYIHISFIENDILVWWKGVVEKSLKSPVWQKNSEHKQWYSAYNELPYPHQGIIYIYVHSVW